MTNLLFILVCLFMALVVLVYFVERFAKPVEERKMQNMGRIIMLLFLVLATGRLFQHWMGG